MDRGRNLRSFARTEREGVLMEWTWARRRRGTEMCVLQAAVLVTLLSCCIRRAGGDRGEAANAQVCLRLCMRDLLKCPAPLEI